jgi:hypothetical protein
MLVKLEVGRVMGPFKDQLLDTVGKKISTLDVRINKIKAFLLKSTKHLQDYIDAKGLGADLDLPPSAPTDKVKATAKSTFPEDVDHPKP